MTGQPRPEGERPVSPQEITPATLEVFYSEIEADRFSQPDFNDIFSENAGLEAMRDALPAVKDKKQFLLMLRLLQLQLHSQDCPFPVVEDATMDTYRTHPERDDVWHEWYEDILEQDYIYGQFLKHMDYRARRSATIVYRLVETQREIDRFRTVVDVSDLLKPDRDGGA